jgi:nucleotide-binding universal stress UspA family protein
MYESIYIPVDNSAHSNRAIDVGVDVAAAFTSKLTGCHVYAARMHDYRFKQMEYTLPEEYLAEDELHRQRKIHDSLISMGLELVSDCYLNPIAEKAEGRGLSVERKMIDGKHSTELLHDIDESDYDLVVLGALGVGRTKDSRIGSVAVRLARETQRDTWIVKHVPGADDAERDTILVGIDGSPQSFGALGVGIELAKRFDKKLEIIGIYDPYLHYAVFKGIVEVLTDKAAKVFRFEEQNQLHEEVIDTGLAQIYQSHLNVAEQMARDAGIDVAKTLLDGKAFQKILDHARKANPWVLILGRTGIHSPESVTGLGSNTENLLWQVDCDILLTNRTLVPELDLKADESIHWTEEAEERMTRVPDQVKGIARRAILRLALEKGHSVVSSDLVTEAMERFMPKATSKATEKLAEALILEQSKAQSLAVCKSCGQAARVPDPVKCSVCGGEEFETLDPAAVERIIADEGGVEEETTYDGRRLRWTHEARKALWGAFTDAYQRRRAKARIEKSARSRKLDPITLEFANAFIEEEGGVVYKGVVDGNGHQSPVASRPAAGARDEGRGTRDQKPGAEVEPEAKLIARDGENNPLVSRFEWSEDAVARVFRVPAGFMRDKTQTRIEELAEQKHVATIDLQVVEDGIAVGRKMMAEMLGQQKQAEANSGNGAEACPADEAPATKVQRSSEDGLALNEVGLMREREKRRQELSAEEN